MMTDIFIIKIGTIDRFRIRVDIERKDNHCFCVDEAVCIGSSTHGDLWKNIAIKQSFSQATSEIIKKVEKEHEDRLHDQINNIYYQIIDQRENPDKN